ASADATVTVHDVTAPSVVTKNIDVNLDATGHATIVAADVDGGTTDACGPISLSIDKSAFSCANLGPNTVKLTATDGSLNSASADATVTVHDVTAPSVVTKNIDVNLDATGHATIVAAAVDGGTTDACGPISLSIDKSAFTCANLGPNTVKLTATDGSLNSASADATVTVHDVTSPVTPTIPTASGQCSVTVTAPTTTDTCAGTVTGTTSDPLTYNPQGTRVIHLPFSDG